MCYCLEFEAKHLCKKCNKVYLCQEFMWVQAPLITRSQPATFPKKNKQKWSSNKKQGGQQRAFQVYGWLNQLSIILPDGSAAPPIDAQRQRSFRQWYSRHLRLVCSGRRKREEKERTSPPQTASEVEQKRQKAPERDREEETERKRRGCVEFKERHQRLGPPARSV